MSRLNQCTSTANSFRTSQDSLQYKTVAFARTNPASRAYILLPLPARSVINCEAAARWLERGLCHALSRARQKLQEQEHAARRHRRSFSREGC